MGASELLERLRTGGAAELSAEEEELLRGAGRLLREADTRLAGPIRVLEIGGVLVLQERTTSGRPVARIVPSLGSADALIAGRLAVYERMWDGCGCSVDYLGS